MPKLETAGRHSATVKNAELGESQTGNDVGSCISGCISEADARLIAAAPDLLAALKEAVVAGAELSEDKADISKWEAAIAKAEGTT